MYVRYTGEVLALCSAGAPTITEPMACAVMLAVWHTAGQVSRRALARLSSVCTVRSIYTTFLVQVQPIQPLYCARRSLLPKGSYLMLPPCACGTESIHCDVSSNSILNRMAACLCNTKVAPGVYHWRLDCSAVLAYVCARVPVLACYIIRVAVDQAVMQ